MNSYTHPVTTPHGPDGPFMFHAYRRPPFPGATPSTICGIPMPRHASPMTNRTVIYCPSCHEDDEQ